MQQRKLSNIIESSVYMRIVGIIQARMGSTRLPGKVLVDIEGKSVLEHVVTRVGQSRLIDEIVIATTDLDRDNEIIAETERLGVSSFRGSEDDVLSRYYHAASKYKADIVVRITSDCPLIDPVVIDDTIDYYLNNNFDIVTNVGPFDDKRTFPRGMDLEVFSMDRLTGTYKNARESHDREHVTPYIYENNNTGLYIGDKDCSKYRFTLDTEEDLKVVSEIIGSFKDNLNNMTLESIALFLDENKEIMDINKDIEQRNINGGIK